MATIRSWRMCAVSADNIGEFAMTILEKFLYCAAVAVAVVNLFGAVAIFLKAAWDSIR